MGLPPKERACLLLKDVFDYTLEEIAELVDSTVGGVQSRAQSCSVEISRIAATNGTPTQQDPEMSKLLNLYVERFNRRDWTDS